MPSGVGARSGAETAPAPPQGRPVGPEALIGQIQKLLWQLAAAAPPAPVPGLVLTPRELDHLAAVLGLASTITGERLLTAVDRLASLRIGDIRIPFTPGQLAELQHRAAKRGRTVEAEMRAVVARIEDEIFYKGGG